MGVGPAADLGTSSFLEVPQLPRPASKVLTPSLRGAILDPLPAGTNASGAMEMVGGGSHPVRHSLLQLPRTKAEMDRLLQGTWPS